MYGQVAEKVGVGERRVERHEGPVDHSEVGPVGPVRNRAIDSVHKRHDLFHEDAVVVVPSCTDILRVSAAADERRQEHHDHRAHAFADYVILRYLAGSCTGSFVAEQLL